MGVIGLCSAIGRGFDRCNEGDNRGKLVGLGKGRIGGYWFVFGHRPGV
nr:MAG TPA: hypothetical protein [Bacteriophage sp.]